MIAGNASMPSYSSDTQMTGNTEAGYARITLIESAPVLKDLTIEGGIIDEPIEIGRYTYHVQIPSGSFETNITAIPTSSATIIGDGNVTLKESETHHIIVMGENGELEVYNIIPYLENVYLDNISFAEINFQYIPTVYEYTLEVPNNTRKLTPMITAADGVSYEIEGDLNLKVGDNTIKIISFHFNIFNFSCS